MLCLTEEVGCNVLWRGTVICKNQNLTWPCKHINIYMTIYFFFRQCNEDIAGARNLIDTRNTRCPICHRRNGLRSPHFEDLTDTKKMCRNKNIRIEHTVLGRDRHDNFLYARNQCRNCIHQNGRRICRRPPRDIDANA